MVPTLVARVRALACTMMRAPPHPLQPLTLWWYRACPATSYIVREPVRIAVHYLCGWFLIDLVASLPYDFIVGRGSMWGLLSLLRLFSLVKVETVEKRLTASLEMSPTSRLLLRLVKLFAYMLFIAHITACVWFLIAKQEDNPDASWIYLYGIHDASWEESLLSSYYWAFTTLTTVGCVR